MPAAKAKASHKASKPKSPKPTPSPEKRRFVDEPLKPVKVQPVRVDGTNCRSDDDAREGCFVTIIAGEYTGRLASFEQVQSYGKDGYPTEIIVRTRDADSMWLSVPYADVRPAATNGGR